MRESYFWHKLHSLSGIIPVGFYMVQHLTLNSFSLAGAKKFDGLIEFFMSAPPHLLLALEVVAIWVPLLFHAVYGVFIAARADQNYHEKAYRYRENRYFLLQRISGIVAFIFLAIHVYTTTVMAKLGPEGHDVILYSAWTDRLTSGGNYSVLILYCIGVMACTYHLSYGIWNFCIRWGITVSEKAQNSMAKFSMGAFVVLTGLGFMALYGFLNPVFEKQEGPIEANVSTEFTPTSR